LVALLLMILITLRISAGIRLRTRRRPDSASTFFNAAMAYLFLGSA